jgi:uncharacterized protein
MANHLIEPILNNSECEKFFTDTFEGILIMCRDSEPYAIPINHAYFNGKLYFHTGLTGRKFEFIKKNPSVCYAVSKYFGSHNLSNKKKRCHGPWESIVAYGKACIINDYEEQAKAFKIFMRWYGVKDYKMKFKSKVKTSIIVINLEYMTARREMEEGKYEYYLWLPEKV